MRRKRTDGYFRCCATPRDMGHMDGCPHAAWRKRARGYNYAPVYARRMRKVLARATRAERNAGRTWYPQARATLASIALRYDRTVSEVAYVCAALSCNKSWADNIRLTHTFYHDVTNGVAPSGHYRQCLDVAQEVYNGAPGRSVVVGPKVAPFAIALFEGGGNAAVVDRHMWRAAGGKGRLTLKRHREMAAALRAIARDEFLSVTEAQAIIWTVQRGSAD